MRAVVLALLALVALAPAFAATSQVPVEGPVGAAVPVWSAPCVGAPIDPRVEEDHVALRWSRVACAESFRVMRAVAGERPALLVEVGQIGHVDVTVERGTSYVYAIEPVRADGTVGAPGPRALVIVP